jgi:serine/threonine-protein kinase
VEEKRTPVAGTLLGFGAIAVVFALGGSLLQWSARGEREAAQAGSKKLELAPANAGALRVVATPWAEVTIDGQRIDVTPMARAIPLAAGTHYVTLSHPNAAPEKRVVPITAGETTSLEVTMKLTMPVDRDAGAAAGARAEDGGP